MRRSERSGRRFGWPVRIGLILFVFAVAAVGDGLRPLQSFTTQASGPLVATPVDAAKRFELRFDTVVNSDRYVDILSASGPNGESLRLQLQPRGRLMLLVFGIADPPVLLSEHFALHRKHRLILTGRPDGGIDVTVDGEQVHRTLSSLQQLQSSAQIGSSDFTFRFNQIAFGGAINGARAPVVVTGFFFRGDYARRFPRPLEIAIALILIAALLWALWPSLERVESPQDASVAVGAALVVVVCTACGFALYLLNVPYGNWAVLLAMGVGAMAAIPLAPKLSGVLPAGVTRVAVPLLPVLVAASLLPLPNFIVVLRMFEFSPLLAATGVVFILSLGNIALRTAVRNDGTSYLERATAALPYVLFAVLSLRTDALFSPINMLHWEYFVGPIRAVHEGGWLLWDVPSQYGFLNVALAAALPVRPTVQSFYVFQAVLSFIAASLFYRALYARLRIHWVTAACIVVAVFFFADPLLIGPAPYPSAGAVRFLWCYVLLTLVAEYLLGRRPSLMRFACSAGVAWAIGLFWSAESAVYCSTIFFAPLIAAAVMRKSEIAAAGAGRMFGLPVICAAGIFFMINLVYVLALGHFPDWTMYVMYAAGYGGGFGERLLAPHGPIWLVAAILFGASAVFVGLRRQEESTAAACAVVAAGACCWIITTYYVGRAFPVVITTLMPLLVFSALIVIRASEMAGKRPLLNSVMVPVIALMCGSVVVNSNAASTFPRAVSVNTMASQRLPVAGPQLAGLLSQRSIEPSTPIVYYDTWVAMPRSVSGPFDRTWLPTPLQQLETPIRSAVRDRVIDRFVARHRLQGYFVQALGAENTPESAAKWFRLLRHSYRIEIVGKTQDYRLLRFTLRTQASAASR